MGTVPPSGCKAELIADNMAQFTTRTAKGPLGLLARLALPVLGAITLAACGPSPPPTVHLEIASDGDYMTFKPTDLTVQTGAHVVLTFHHRGTIITQQHDWVLARPGAMKALMAEADKMAEAAPTHTGSFLKPGDPRVIAATEPIDKGQTATVEFAAPAPGDYPFFCSTPGHGESMNGVLHVTAQ
jgi:azurin